MIEFSKDDLMVETEDKALLYSEYIDVCLEHACDTETALSMFDEMTCGEANEHTVENVSEFFMVVFGE